MSTFCDLSKFVVTRAPGVHPEKETEVIAYRAVSSIVSENYVTGETKVIRPPSESDPFVIALRTKMGEVESVGTCIVTWDIQAVDLDREKCRILRDKLTTLLEGDA